MRKTQLFEAMNAAIQKGVRKLNPQRDGIFGNECTENGYVYMLYVICMKECGVAGFFAWGFARTTPNDTGIIVTWAQGLAHITPKGAAVALTQQDIETFKKMAQNLH